MNMTLNKRAARNIKNNLAFYIISTILTVFVSTFMIAAISSGKTLEKITNDFLEEYQAEDAEFATYTPISDEELAALEDQYDVTLELSRYKDVQFGDATLRVFDMPQKVNLFDVRDGALPAEGEALITQNFADLHEIAVGDTVETDEGIFTVSGFTTKSDYLYMVQTLGSGYRDNEKFGILIVNSSDFDKLDAEETSYYSIIYHADNQKEVRKKIHAEYGISSYLSSANNTRLYMALNQGGDVANMALLVTPVIFLIVIALIVMIFGRRIKSEQALLGTFLALGFSRREITRHYTRFAVLPGVLGSVLGVLAAIPATRFLSYFYIEYDFECLQYHTTYYVSSIVCALILPTLLYCLTVALRCRKLLRQSPTELLRHTGSDRKSIGIFKNRRIKTATKLRVRSVIGHPGRGLVTLLGVCIAAICIMVGFMMDDSMDDLLDNGVTSSVTYKYMYTLNTIGEGTPDEGEGILQVGYEITGNVVNLNVVGIENDSAYYPTETADGEKLDLTQYYISSAAAEIYGVKKGGTITFSSVLDLTEHTVKISGIVEDDGHSAVYTSRENAADLAGLDGDLYNVVVSDKKLNIDSSIVAKETEVTDIADSVRDLTGAVDAIVLIFKVLGVLLGIGILYLVINMIVQEGKNGISVMKVLGFSQREIAGRVLNVNHVLVVLGYLLGIPAAYAITKIGYADTVENFGMQMYPVISAKGVLFTFVLTWVAYEASLFLQKRKLAKIDMVEALKENNRDE